jgi:hypothetical protein
MALQQRTRLYEFLARIDRVGGADRVVGMHASHLVEVYDDDTGTVVSATISEATPLDWAGLASIMHEDDRALLMAALAPPEPE